MEDAYPDGVQTGSVVLDIGGDIGALIVYTTEELRGCEIEVSLKGNDVRRIHTGVLERRIGERPVIAAVFPALRAGEYDLWQHDPGRDRVIIAGGAVTEVDCRAAADTAALRVKPPVPVLQSGNVVSAAPMGTAPMLYTEEGRVAWDRMWTDFCALALDGGPPHRGTLLGPVDPGAVLADPEGYERVVAEIERGFRLVSGLPTLRGGPGWVGVECGDEGMARWIERAAREENVDVRRQGAALFLPAGPAFRIDKEIKNVITAIAKTHHYWTQHGDW